jgi:hypothetical protein
LISFSVTVRVHIGADVERPSWWLMVVYGPQEDSDKLLFLEELSAIRDACSGLWAIIGDFNSSSKRQTKTTTQSIDAT